MRGNGGIIEPFVARDRGMNLLEDVAKEGLFVWGNGIGLMALKAHVTGPTLRRCLFSKIGKQCVPPAGHRPGIAQHVPETRLGPCARILNRLVVDG